MSARVQEMYVMHDAPLAAQLVDALFWRCTSRSTQSYAVSFPCLTVGFLIENLRVDVGN